MERSEYIRYVNAMVEGVQQAVSPIFISKQVGQGSRLDFTQIVSGGTATHVKLRGQTFFVTAGHVYAEFEKVRISDARAELRLLPSKRARTIDLSHAEVMEKSVRPFDICSISAIGVIADNDIRFISIGDAWSPRATPGERVMWVGFPGKDRRRDNNRHHQEYDLAVAVMLGHVNVVSESTITILRENWDVDSEDGVAKLDPGGMSGGALFGLRGEDGETWHAELVGFIIEGQSMFEEMDATFPIVRAVHADFLSPDGTLDDLRIPTRGRGVIAPVRFAETRSTEHEKPRPPA